MGAAEDEQAGRRRRGRIIVLVAVLLVGIPLLLNWWFTEQASQRAEDVAETARARARALDESDLRALRHEEIATGESGGYAGALGLEDEWRGTTLGHPVRLVFEARAGWSAKCVQVVLTPGTAETQIVDPTGNGCTVDG